MTAAGWAALAITIFGAFSYGAGSILQAVGARRSTGTVRTLGHPLYLIGVGCDLVAWAGSMIALRELAVYQVQSVLAGSLAVTVVAARLFLASRLRVRDVAAVAVTIAALAVLAMSAGPQEQVTPSAMLRLGFCAAALATALIGWGATKIGSPGIVAALAGLSFGGAALSSRALSLPAQPMEHLSAAALAIVTEPLIAALVTFAATGMLLYTNALQHGQVGPVTAVLWIGEVIAPSAVALALLGDTVRIGWDLPAAVAGLVTVGAAVLLATAPATSATAQPPDAQPTGAPRPPIPVAGRRPAALPSRDPQSATIVWWGAPPIWRPPNRTTAARTAQIAAEPAGGHPHRRQLTRADPPALPTAAPRPAIPAAAATQPSRAHPLELEPSRYQSTEAQPSRAHPLELEPSRYQSTEAQPLIDRQSGTSLWSQAQPIWRPPTRTTAARTPQTVPEPTWDHPHRTRPTWADPPGGEQSLDQPDEPRPSWPPRSGAQAIWALPSSDQIADARRSGGQST